jgi:capsular exopolysaccharide synthesis family protein
VPPSWAGNSRQAAGAAADGPSSAPTRLGLVDVHAPSGEPFRTLRLALDLRPHEGKAATVILTSADPGEGKSTIAANFALVAAVDEKSVLLVDADLRKPTQHELFGVPRSPGVTDVIAGRAEFATATHRMTLSTSASQGRRFDLLTAGTALPNAGDVTSSAAMAELLRTLSRTYDIVVVDTPPVLAAADAASIAAHTNAEVVFVVSHKGRKRRVSRAVKKLELVGAKVIGFVVNREGRLSEYGYY